jgi:hypothetical protein
MAPARGRPQHYRLQDIKAARAKLAGNLPTLWVNIIAVVPGLPR